MKTLLKTLLVAVLAICTLDAKSGGFGSSSRSSSSYSSRSYSSGSKSYTSSSKTYKPGSSSAQTSTRVGSKVEVSRYQAAVKSGKAFTTRESAVADFKAKNANAFTNKFKTEPSSRPSYIPTNYNTGGKSYSIVYNKNAGGYGYWNGGGPGLGTWIMYDTFSDMAMMNTLMSRQNYYIGQPVVSSIGSGLKFLMWFGVGLFVAVIGLFLVIKITS